MEKQDWMNLQSGTDVRGTAIEGVAGDPVTLTDEAVRGILRAYCHGLRAKARQTKTDHRGRTRFPPFGGAHRRLRGGCDRGQRLRRAADGPLFHPIHVHAAAGKRHRRGCVRHDHGKPPPLPEERTEILYERRGPGGKGYCGIARRGERWQGPLRCRARQRARAALHRPLCGRARTLCTRKDGLREAAGGKKSHRGRW